MGGSPKLAPNSILMVLVDLDVHQIVGYHYFDHHQPSRGSSVRLGVLKSKFMATLFSKTFDFDQPFQRFFCEKR